MWGNSDMNKEDELMEAVNNFLRDENKRAFISSLEDWFKSIYTELKQQGRTDEEIGKEVSGLCYKVESSISDPHQNDMLRDVLASALLQFFVGEIKQCQCQEQAWEKMVAKS